MFFQVSLGHFVLVLLAFVVFGLVYSVFSQKTLTQARYIRHWATSYPDAVHSLVEKCTARNAIMVGLVLLLATRPRRIGPIPVA